MGGMVWGNGMGGIGYDIGVNVMGGIIGYGGDGMGEWYGGAYGMG